MNLPYLIFEPRSLPHGQDPMIEKIIKEYYLPKLAHSAKLVPHVYIYAPKYKYSKAIKDKDVAKICKVFK